MTEGLLPLIATAGLAVVALNFIMCLARAIIGPSAFDRILALDGITFNLAGAVVLVSMALGTAAFMDFVLVIALLGFVSTIALTAYLEKRLGS
jgi:multisubunit Na+/H+ antiporter MnhF subunit